MPRYHIILTKVKRASLKCMVGCMRPVFDHLFAYDITFLTLDYTNLIKYNLTKILLPCCWLIRSCKRIFFLAIFSLKGNALIFSSSTDFGSFLSSYSSSNSSSSSSEASLPSSSAFSSSSRRSLKIEMFYWNV